MTILTSRSVLVAPAADLSAVLTVGQDVQSSEAIVPASVRRYAGGRDRVVTSPGRTSRVSFSCRFVDRGTYLSLLDLAGVTVLVRDQRGLRVWGVLSSVAAVEFRAGDELEEVSFTLTSVTVSEQV